MNTTRGRPVVQQVGVLWHCLQHKFGCVIFAKFGLSFNPEFVRAKRQTQDVKVNRGRGQEDLQGEYPVLMNNSSQMFSQKVRALTVCCFFTALGEV